ncbi:unnamed protein product [Thelazia callipaeda]|uniref:DNA topoisomerase 2-binding protein 1 n=1 Tax=Thelazia callipaeda TaxID=103827 RepID=A0A158RAN1_THECL|nr:unnamed protein product [Thelazia callipaeda]
MPKSRRVKKWSKTEDSELTKNYHLWMLKAEVEQESFDSFHADELSRQQHLFELMENKSLNPKWLTSADCLKRQYSSDDLYVLPAFRGKAFHHLLSLKCRIYGSLALLTSLKQKERLPKRHSPIWSTTLLGSVVCFSGIEIKTRLMFYKQQSSLVKAMGGTISKAFTEKVTHLVADSQNTTSKKFTTAIELSIPVLSVNWVFDAWNQAKSFCESSCVDECFTRKHRLKIFDKCVISCSGLVPHDRSILSRLVEANGGVYSGNMKKNHCTHLVTNMNSGEKYKVAHKWGWDQIKIVRLRWITKSVEEGHRLPEKMFETKPNSEIKCSTPLKSQLIEFQVPPNLEISNIPRSYDQNEGEMLLTNDKPVSNEASTVRATKNESHFSEIVESRLFESSCMKMRHVQETNIISDPIVPLDLDAFQFNDFMNKCVIYLCGVAHENFKKYKWLTNRVGSRRRDQLIYEDITHVVVGIQKLDWELIEQLKEKALHNVKVITCEWLLDCIKAQKVLNEEDYLIFKREEDEYHISSHTLSEGDVRRYNYSCGSRRKAKLRITEVGSKVLGDAVSKLTNKKSGCMDNNADSELLIVVEEEDEHRLFAGLVFRIVVRDDNFRDRLVCDIERQGGIVERDTKFWVNYMVCEVLDYLLDVSMPDFNCGDIVSLFWLRECVEKGAIMNAEKHPLYRPVEASNVLKIFEGHTIGLSALPVEERNIFAAMLYKFGAKVYCRLKHDTHLNIFTHIVTGFETLHCEEARQMGIPVLDPSWILESVVQNKLQPVEHYLFSDQLFKNYSRKDYLWTHACKDKQYSAKSNQNCVHEPAVQAPIDDNEKRVDVDFPILEAAQEMMGNAEVHVENPGLGMLNYSEESIAQVHQQKSVGDNLVAALNFTDAYDYVNKMNTQNTSRKSDSWVGLYISKNDTAVGQILNEAVIKTAQAHETVHISPGKAVCDYNRIQIRENKRKATETIAIGHINSPKKVRTIMVDNICSSDASKDEKKRRIAERLAKLAVEKEEFMRAREAKKEIEREMEKKDRVSPPEKFEMRCTERKFVEPPQPECYGWKESSPRPLATQILNPFETDEIEKNHTPPPNEANEQNEDDKKCDVRVSESTVMAESFDVPVRRICFTSTTGHDRNLLMSMVLELGGEICDEFDERVTHLVCGRIVRNEKLLCSIAKGLFVIDEEYVLDSYAQSKWLEIDDYEWGSDCSFKKHQIMCQRFISFALACHRWRLKIEKDPTQKAFFGWKALFYCSRRRFLELKRIIVFGGGEANLRDDVCSLQEFTIALIEKSRFWNSKEVTELIENNIPCFGTDYIATYLTLERRDEMENYYHQDYAKELKRISRT